MILYPQTAKSDIYWPEPIENMYQMLGGGVATGLAPKLPHLGLADILFMTLMMCLPKEQRPWGIVTWMVGIFLLSRPSLYALTERTQQRLLAPEVEAVRSVAALGSEELIVLTPARLARTVLTAAFPGKIALRPLQQVLAEAFDEKRSVGWLSELLTEAGQRAGAALAALDTSPLGTLIVVRDEPFSSTSLCCWSSTR